MFASNRNPRTLLSLPGRDKAVSVLNSEGSVRKALRLGGWRHRLHSVKLPSGDQLTLIEDMSELLDKEWKDES